MHPNKSCFSVNPKAFNPKLLNLDLEVFSELYFFLTFGSMSLSINDDVIWIALLQLFYELLFVGIPWQGKIFNFGGKSVDVFVAFFT